MKKILLVSLLTLAIAILIFSLMPTKSVSGGITPHVQAQEIVKEPTLKEKLIAADLPTREKIVKELVRKYATKYHVSESEMLTTLRCENKTFAPNLQSGHRYKFNAPKRGIVAGEQEKSFGLSMIHLPDHPTVSLDQATDPEFAVSFMAEKFANGEQTAWTCWKMFYQ